MKQHHITLTEPAHGESLAEDLPLMAALLQRRRALLWLGSAGATVIAGCGGSDSSTAASGTTTAATSAASAAAAAPAATTSTSTASTATTSTSTSTSSDTSSSACVADPQETAGPYPADGTNTASGSTSDILTSSGIVRSDIRSSFISSSTTAAGVLTTLTLTLVNTKSSCAALSGYAIYLWQCDAAGNYSLYSAPTESYLRGVQVTNSSGQVTFTTIFPACYAGRWPHMHFEVFASAATATTGKNALLTSQLAMPTAVCSAIFPNVSQYSQSVSNFKNVSLSSDMVFGDNTAAQIAAMTPTFTGSASAGYTATATIGLAV